MSDKINSEHFFNVVCLQKFSCNGQIWIMAAKETMYYKF